MRASKLNGSRIKKVDGKSRFYYDITAESIPVVAPEESPEERVKMLFEEMRSSLKSELKEKIWAIEKPFAFELLVNQLISEMGYGESESTPQSRDGGIDGNVYEDKLHLRKICTQAKLYNVNKKVTAEQIRGFGDSLNGCDGIFVTASDFTVDAINEGNKVRPSGSRIALINGDQLVDHMIDHNIGVRVKEQTKAYTLKEVDEQFFEILQR